MLQPKLLQTCVLLLPVVLGACTQQKQPAPTPPQILAPTVSTTSGNQNPPPNPIAFTDIVQWEKETGFYFSTHHVNTGAKGLYTNPYAVDIVFNGGPLLRGDRIFVKDSSGQEVPKVDETATPDTTQDQYAIGFNANQASPNNPYYYLVLSPKTQHAGTNSHDHGQQLTYTLVDENSSGHAETPITLTFVAPSRCLANSIQVSDMMPKKGQSITITWDAGPCKAAVVTARTGSGATIGGLGNTNSIGGPYLFQRSSAQYDVSYTGTSTQFQIEDDTTYDVYAIDGVWRQDRKSAQAKVQSAGGGSVSTGCPNNAPPQNFDMRVECSLGCYSFPGYRACSQSAATAELQGQYGGCTVKTGADCPQ
jgi:hypothetical protein